MEFKTSEEEYFNLILFALRKLLDVEFRSEKQRNIFIYIYPFMRDGEEWTYSNLFREIAKDPEKKRFIKSHTNLWHHLEQMTKLGLLNKIEGESKKNIKYSLNQKGLDNFSKITQIIQNRAYKGQLDAHYSQIYIITCSIAREISSIYPEETGAQVFELARSLFEVGVELAVKDLIPKKVLTRQCRNCYYPYQPKRKKDGIRQAAKEGEGSERSGIQGSSQPLSESIKIFIEENGKGEPVLGDTIKSHFQSLGIPETEIASELNELLDGNGLYQPIPNKYKVIR